MKISQGGGKKWGTRIWFTTLTTLCDSAKVYQTICLLRVTEFEFALISWSGGRYLLGPDVSKAQISATKSLFFASKTVFPVVFQRSKHKNVVSVAFWLVFCFLLVVLRYFCDIWNVCTFWTHFVSCDLVFWAWMVSHALGLLFWAQFLEYRNLTWLGAFLSGEPLRLSAGGFPRFNFVLQFWMDQKVWQRNPSCWFRSWRKTFSALRYQDPIILHRFSQIEEFFGDRNNSVW